jgi:anti-anti-sigma factor
MLNLKIQNLGDVTVFRCVGRLTSDDVDGLRKAVLSQSQLRVAVLDLAEISAVDAAGLGMLAGLRNWAKSAGKQLKLMNIVPRVDEVLELTGLRSVFEICSVREMLDLLCRAAHPTQSESRALAQTPALAMAV